MRRFYEADLSAQQSPAQAHAWVPRADADALRSGRHFGAPSKRTQEARCVNRGHHGGPSNPPGALEPVAGEGFSRGDRLRKRREFEECYASGTRVSGRHLLVFLLPEAGPSRLGISVPRRVGGAVVRNRVRRRLREIFRRNRALLRIPVRLVIHARPSAAAASFEDLLADYMTVVGRAAERRRSGR